MVNLSTKYVNTCICQKQKVFLGIHGETFYWSVITLMSYSCQPRWLSWWNVCFGVLNPDLILVLLNLKKEAVVYLNCATIGRTISA